MKRAFVVLVVATLTSLGLVSTASAENQPSQGEHSTGRNDAGFGGGPHCHVLVVDSAQSQFDFISVFPSHTAHVHTGLAEGVFVADANCDGVP
ncbi:MAG TPA: hypothetical protein VK306_16265 [Acidimicrobiales bacterium]|nr:hypothetical protein [Acidimicrobiales bacterium]